MWKIGVKCLCTIGMFIFLIIPTWVSGTPVFAQKEMSLVEAIRQISKDYGVYFTFDHTLVKNITVKYETKKDLSIEQAISGVLSETDLNFKFYDNRFVILYKNDKEGLESLKQMMEHFGDIIEEGEKDKIRHKIRPLAEISLRPGWKPAPRKLTGLVLNINGTVADQSGEPLIGVNVLVKGTDNGTATDFDGSYTLEDVNENATLIFSYIGYQTVEVPVDGRKEVSIQLVSDSEMLEEVVVVGYGTQKVRDVTGSMVSADMEALEEQPNVSLMQGLQGAVPGLNVGQVDRAGENPNISIRGRTSLSGEGNPLIVLDGVIYRGNLIDLNPNDVESVDILKDASATAIYGSQASNGVILISTSESGGSKDGKPVINFSSQFSFQQPWHELVAQGPDEFIKKIEESDIEQSRTESSGYLERNPNWAQTTNFKTNHEISQFEAGRSFDWYDYVTTDNPYTTKHNLSVSNNLESHHYFASLGYTKQEGYMRDEHYERINARINLGNQITDWFDIDIQSFLSSSNYGPQNYGPVDRYIEPYAHPYDQENNLVQRPYGNPVNPLIEAKADVNDKRINLNGNLTGTIQLPVEGLSYQGRFGNNYKTNKDYYFGSHGSSFQGYGSKMDAVEYNWSLDHILSYNKEFNANHYLDITLLYGMEDRKYSFTNAEGSNFSNHILGYDRLQASETEQQRVSSGGWKESSLYNMGRIVYKIMDRYLITGTVRRDGFSGFSEENKFGVFPSLALGWVLSEETFYKQIAPDWLNWMKLRLSYGTTGNRTIGRYQTLAEVSGSPGYVAGDGTSLLTQWISALESPSLKWEKTTGINVGIDFGTVNGRLRGSIDYYNKNTSDLLYSVDIPAISRFETFPDNLGEVHNQGVDFTFSSVNMDQGDFTWSSDINFSYNRNKINTLLGFDVDGDGKEDDLISEGLFIGESIGAIFDYSIDGLWQLNDEIFDGYEFGSYKVQDLDGNGLIDGNDRSIIGNTRPAYRFSINNTVKYGDWTLRFFINSIQGGKNRYLGEDNLYSFAIFNGESHFNFSFPEGLNYWTPENPNARYQRPGISGASGIAGTRYSSRSFVRLQNLSLSYNLGSIIPTVFRNAKVSLSTQNLITLTKWPGWDPETGVGITRGGRPVMKSFSLGIDVQF
ncbi:SusC/RagA family TonB-linked outer membrane protein [Membranihabitans maritimus]|uniref:SusC/RagA family TonB-linked outer membrane protein n=1 Tax=Membranihabitans maritimus TaxID=2904244 RepID=UPI001F01CB66|nr:TonB-dependent receptor [Membranihabitans maritimus]